MNANVTRDDARIWMVGGFLALCLGMMLATILFIAWRGAKAFWPKPIEVIILNQVDGPSELIVGQRLSQDEQSVRIRTSDPGFGKSIASRWYETMGRIGACPIGLDSTS